MLKIKCLKADNCHLFKQLYSSDGSTSKIYLSILFMLVDEPQHSLLCVHYIHRPDWPKTAVTTHVCMPAGSKISRKKWQKVTETIGYTHIVNFRHHRLLRHCFSVAAAAVGVRRARSAKADAQMSQMNGIPPSADRPFLGAALAPPLECPRPAASVRAARPPRRRHRPRDTGQSTGGGHGLRGGRRAVGATWLAERQIGALEKGETAGWPVQVRAAKDAGSVAPVREAEGFSGRIFILVIYIVAFLADLAIKTGFTCRRFRADFFPSDLTAKCAWIFFIPLDIVYILILALRY